MVQVSCVLSVGRGGVPVLRKAVSDRAVCDRGPLKEFCG